jgi:ABC-type branched-subunit amino acid transport system ATPase component
VPKEKALFVFDEPTTGLHFHDIKTVSFFEALIEKGHSILVIEHNLDLINVPIGLLIWARRWRKWRQTLATGTLRR